MQESDMRRNRKIVARGVLIGFMVLALRDCDIARANTPEYFSRVVDAIYRIEGGEKTRFPFGVKSVRCEGYSECRRVCANTVRNNWRRWNEADRPGEFLDFLGNRYCPATVDPVGNKNWKKNIKRMVRI